MNKSELVQAIAKVSGTTLRNTGELLDAFAETVAEAMKRGEEVNWIGFGAFSVVDRSARVARNFRTGEQMKVAASRTVKFKAGKMLKDYVK